MTLWQRTDGSLIGGGARESRDGLITYFRSHNVPALLEFYPEINSMVGITLLVDPDHRVAAIEGNGPASGLELEDVAADLAEKFDLGVIVGDVSVELPDEVEDLPQEEDSPEQTEHPDQLDPVDQTGEEDIPADEINLGSVHPVRAITITAAPADFFPALARSLGEPVTTASAGYLSVVLTSRGETVPGAFGWDEAMLPVVQLIADGPDRSVSAQTDELESTARTWGSERILVAGEGTLPPELAAALEGLDSSDDDARVIASISPTADVAAVRETLHASARLGPTALLEALGCGAEFAYFLDGTLSAEELPGARMWEPVTTGQLLRSSVADVLDEAADLRVLEFVSEIDERWPAVTRTWSLAKAAAGTALLVASLRSDRRWRTAQVVTGSVLLLDALADVVILDWLRRRREYPD